MKIENEFSVSIPIDQAWEVLTDLEGVASCLPGAQLTGREGPNFLGKVKVKVGPVTTEYAGTASLAEKDDATHRAVIEARGRDSRGSGTASATITAQLRAGGEHTTVTIDTDLKISGKIAQFGSSMIAEVSEKLLGQFVESLEAKLAAGNGVLEAREPLPAPGRTAGSTVSQEDELHPDVGSRTEDDPAALDLLELAGTSVAKRVVPLAIGAIVVVAVIVYVATR